MLKNHDDITIINSYIIILNIIKSWYNLNIIKKLKVPGWFLNG